MDISVTIVCAVFNHAKYLRRALDGFVMQKTSFRFIALIHDDCSTDESADIIRQYESKYPHLIKGIYETENQYSKGNGALRAAIVPFINSKYVAFCEGDDYWTDPLKLQKQYDALEKNDLCDICSHSVERISEKGDSTNTYISPSYKDKVFTIKEVIYGGGGFVGTSSLFMRSNIYTENPPFRMALTCDYTLQIFGSLRGGMLFLKDKMSIYRLASEGSWTNRMKADWKKQYLFQNRIVNMLLELDKYSDLKYHDTIAKTVHRIYWEQVYNNMSVIEAFRRKLLFLIPPKYRFKMIIKSILKNI